MCGRCVASPAAPAAAAAPPSLRVLLSDLLRLAVGDAGLGACFDEADTPLVGPCRRALKRLAASSPDPLASLASPQLLAGLGCVVGALAASSAQNGDAPAAVLDDDAAAPQQPKQQPPPLLPWLGSPEPGDGVASSARRLTDAFVHGVRDAPPPRPLDPLLILLALSLASPSRLADEPGGEDATLLCGAVAGQLYVALGGGGRAGEMLVAAGPDARAAAARCVSAFPCSPSGAAANAVRQAGYAAAAAANAEAAARNAEAAASRRLARGDWRCLGCGLINFSDRRVCYGCLKPSPTQAATESGASGPSLASNRSWQDDRDGDWAAPSDGERWGGRGGEPKSKTSGNGGGMFGAARREQKTTAAAAAAERLRRSGRGGSAGGGRGDGGRGGGGRGGGGRGDGARGGGGRGSGGRGSGGRGGNARGGEESGGRRDW